MKKKFILISIFSASLLLSSCSSVYEFHKPSLTQETKNVFENRSYQNLVDSIFGKREIAKNDYIISQNSLDLNKTATELKYHLIFSRAFFYDNIANKVVDKNYNKISNESEVMIDSFLLKNWLFLLTHIDKLTFALNPFLSEFSTNENQKNFDDINNKMIKISDKNFSFIKIAKDSLFDWNDTAYYLVFENSKFLRLVVSKKDNLIQAKLDTTLFVLDKIPVDKFLFASSLENWISAKEKKYFNEYVKQQELILDKDFGKNQSQFEKNITNFFPNFTTNISDFDSPLKFKKYTLSKIDLEKPIKNKIVSKKISEKSLYFNAYQKYIDPKLDLKNSLENKENNKANYSNTFVFQTQNSEFANKYSNFVNSNLAETNKYQLFFQNDIIANAIKMIYSNLYTNEEIQNQTLSIDNEKYKKDLTFELNFFNGLGSKTNQFLNVNLEPFFRKSSRFYNNLFENNWLWFLANINDAIFIRGNNKNNYLLNLETNFNSQMEKNTSNPDFYQPTSNQFKDITLVLKSSVFDNKHNLLTKKYEIFLLNTDNFIFTIDLEQKFRGNKLIKTKTKLSPWITVFPEFLHKKNHDFPFQKYAFIASGLQKRTINTDDSSSKNMFFDEKNLQNPLFYTLIDFA